LKSDDLLGCNKQALLLKGTDSLSANFELNLLAVNNYGLLLQVWFPYLLGVALREANVVAELLAFASDITLTHN
jgi:hypothetical protein